MPVFVVTCAKGRVRGTDTEFQKVRVEIAAPGPSEALDEFELMFDRACPCLAAMKGGNADVELMAYPAIVFPPLSLAQWCEKWQVSPGYGDRVASACPPMGPSELPTWELHRLTDYAVSSRNGPVVLLVLKQEPVAAAATPEPAAAPVPTHELGGEGG